MDNFGSCWRGFVYGAAFAPFSYRCVCACGVKEFDPVSDLGERPFDRIHQELADFESIHLHFDTSPSIGPAR